MVYQKIREDIRSSKEALERAIENNDNQEQKRWCWVLDFNLRELEHYDNGDELRTDYDSLQFVADKFAEENEGYDCGLLFSRYEDKGADMYETGYTTTGEFYVTPYEVKTVSRKFDRHYQTKVAGRNQKCRYCVTATTQEEFDTDRTPMPDWLKSDTPIHVLNATDKFGRKENAKVTKMVKNGWGLVLVMEGAVLIYCPPDFRDSILGDFWVLCGHTTAFTDRSVQWELKAAVNLEAWSQRIKCEVPKKFLE